MMHLVSWAVLFCATASSAQEPSAQKPSVQKPTTVGLPLVVLRPESSANRHFVFVRIGESIVIDVGENKVPITRGRKPREVGELRWFELVPLALDYDNTKHPPTPIRFKWKELTAFRAMSEISIEAGTHFAKAGSHRIAVFRGSPSFSDGEVTLQTVQQLLEVVVRRDDTYVGYLHELFGTPFVLWPRWMSDNRHQTDARLGADCVALVIYGRRRMGESIPYVSPSRLKHYLRPIGTCPSLDSVCKMRAQVQEGDVLHFGFQTAVLSTDTEPIGILNKTDLVIHTYHEAAEEAPVSDLPYRTHPVQVFRWPGEEQDN